MACHSQNPTELVGYAEGYYLYIAAPIAGKLTELSVKEGDEVSKDQRLFELDSDIEKFSENESVARYLSAHYQYTDITQGKRREEIAVIHAQLEQAKAQAKLAEDDYSRKKNLSTSGFVSAASLDEAEKTLELDKAKIVEISANLRVAELPGRSDQQKSQIASASAAAEVAKQNHWRVDQKRQLAPSRAMVADVFFRPGEYVNAGQPVLSLLPPENIRARFFVPEQQLGVVRVGDRVAVHCDGCAKIIPAHIVRINSKAEYAPPVIYSNEQKSKLVFMVEATPESPFEAELKPGQPITVTLTPVAQPR